MFDQDKTEEATPQRLQKAREKGQIARSQELAAALSLFLAFLLLNQLGGAFASSIFDFCRELYTAPVRLVCEPNSEVQNISKIFFYFLGIFAFFFFALVGIAVCGHLVQTGWIFLPEQIKPDWTRLNPLRGLQRIFSLDGFYRTAFGILKIAICLTVAVLTVYGARHEILVVSSLDFYEMTVWCFRFIISLGLRMSGALLFVSIFDLLWQRWKIARDLRMTPEEIKEEMKETLGNPQILRWRRQRQQQLRRK